MSQPHKCVFCGKVFSTEEEAIDNAVPYFFHGDSPWCGIGQCVCFSCTDEKLVQDQSCGEWVLKDGEELPGGVRTLMDDAEWPATETP